MKLYHKIIISIVSFILNVYFSFRIYELWSKTHRFLFDRKWNNVKLSTFASIEDIAKKMRTFVWKRDTVTELWDAVCTPQKVEAVGFDGSSPHGNDCDEEGIWLTNVINLSMPIDEIQAASFFTVIWFEEETGKFSGHNVCLLQFKYGFRFMDYAMPSPIFDSVDKVAQLVADSYAGWDTTGHGTKKAIVCNWFVQDKNLRLIMKS